MAVGTAAVSADLVFFEGAFRPGLFIGVRDGTIVSVSEESPGTGALTMFPSSAIFPAMVNTHTHTYLSLLRGALDGLPLGEWLQKVYAAIPNFGPEESYLGAALSFGEMLLSGTTTVADFFYLNGRGNENVRAALRAAHDLGIRVVMGRTFLDAEWGGEATRETVDIAKQRFRELRADYDDDPLVEVSPAPHSLYGASRPMIEAAFELAEEYETLWYLHVSDSLKSSEEVVNTFGQRTIPLLDSWGVLSDRLVSVHGLWLSEEELRLLADSGGRLSYNPASNMFFGERIIDVPNLLRRGVKVGLATDGAASNNSQNILSDTRLASLAQKVAAQDPAAIAVDELITLMTAGGADVLNCPVGRLEVGKQADFIVLDTLDFSLLPTASLKSNMVHAASDRAIRHVFCAGREVVRDGKLRLVEHAELAARISKLTLT
jgi:5-methylthioadenosine/S-adenosylhomocysteine deaminase